MSTQTPKPIVLHIGDPIKYNHDTYARFADQFTVIRPPLEELQRSKFITALKERRWGDFSAIFRPFWNTGGEMGNWDEELISLLPTSAKVFASAGAGYNWVDTALLARKGVLYCNGASASSESVADMAIFLILSVFRNTTWSQLAARSLSTERWLDAHQNSAAISYNPRGHTLGIVGLGNIGYMIAQKAFAAFGMRIAYHDLYRKPREQEEAVQATYYDDLDALLSLSDCVLIATPFEGKTLIDAERLQKFKKGSRFINIARGSLVDEAALVEALKSELICAAGLDVHAHEPEVNPDLVTMDNVALTCHTAGASVDAHVGFERLAMENIEGYLMKGRALTPVNLHLLKESSHAKRVALDSASL
ncbi:Glyoxylate reductase 1 [Hyphodiscus hymeniophilus]|uniref:Glyoxylate reductase 1 n=1 Tax=Hyphodiscus hymeniophilus TaxID=353542 RepID=A0A9P7AXL3_9HELO|nr:Glyoxylate reductase 1 [Hyphodiscus hymeniophilus]